MKKMDNYQKPVEVVEVSPNMNYLTRCYDILLRHREELWKWAHTASRSEALAEIVKKQETEWANIIDEIMGRR